MEPSYNVPNTGLLIRLGRVGYAEDGILRWQSYVYACPDLEQILRNKAKTKSLNLAGLNLGRMAVFADCSVATVRRDLRGVIESMRLFAHLAHTVDPHEQIRSILAEIHEARMKKQAPE